MKAFALVFVILAAVSLVGVVLGYTHQVVMAAMSLIAAAYFYPFKKKKYK